MKEIEKKFLVKSVPEDLENYKKVKIEQGYLNSSGAPILRIRRYGNEYILSYKFKLESGMNSANICREEELMLTEESYNHLKEKIDGQMMSKTRYLIPIQDGLIAELDVFEGYLGGLIMVEVEFKSEEDAAKFSPPEWFDKDVTFDYHYRNSYLSGILNISEILEK